MKTPHLVTAIIAATAMVGAGFNAAEMPAKTASSSDEGPLDRPFAKQRGRMGLSQRQKRKDRRRAFANGNRKAFDR